VDSPAPQGPQEALALIERRLTQIFAVEDHVRSQEYLQVPSSDRSDAATVLGFGGLKNGVPFLSNTRVLETSSVIGSAAV
jgi:hypothetical protein